MCPVLLAGPQPPETELGDDHVICEHLPCYYSEAFLVCLIMCSDYFTDFWIKPLLSELPSLIAGN